MVLNLTVGWVCALPHELAASQAMLDEVFDAADQDVADNNVYTLGRIGNHGIVMTCLPTGKYGTESAATVVRDLNRSFKSLRFGLLVGIGAGVPSPRHDIRLGDVVVSKPVHSHGGVIQYDLGKTHSHKFERRSHLNKPSALLLNALSSMQAIHETRPSKITDFVDDILQRNPAMAKDYARPLTNAVHAVDTSKYPQVPHELPLQRSPAVHYGLIASGNRVIADAAERDRISWPDDVLCFEMEAAGLMDSDLSFLVIRGICDFADSTKSDHWQKHAAAAAAAFAKELLSIIPTPAAPSNPFKVGSAEPSWLRVIFQDIRSTKYFVQRPIEMTQLENHLLPASTDSKPLQRRMCILYGLGGIGKTQLALKFAHEHDKSFHSVLMVNANSDSAIKQSFRGLWARILSSKSPTSTDSSENSKVVSSMDDQDVLSRVHAWLAAEGNPGWLLIFDNVDLEKGHPGAYELEHYLPAMNSIGAVLITSRLNSFRRLAPSIDLRGMDDTQALQIIHNQGNPSAPLPALDEHIRGTLSRLQGLPLALTLAGSYIMDTGCSFADYNELYDSQWRNLIEEQDEDMVPEYERPMLETWAMSYDQAARKYLGSTKLLDLSSFFSNEAVNFDLLRVVAGASETQPMWPAWLEDLAQSKLNFLRATKWLLRLSLINANDHGEGFTVHSVVHEWCFQTLLAVDNESCGDMCKVAISLLARNVQNNEGDSGDQYIWRSQHSLPAHISQVLQRLNQCFPGHEVGQLDEASIENLSALGSCMWAHGRLQDAEAILERALMALERTSDSCFDLKLETLGKLGSLYSDQGKLDKGKVMLENTLPMIESAFGPKHANTLKHLHRLGTAYAQVNLPQSAEKIYVRALEGFEELHGTDHLSTLDIVNNLGILRFRDSRLEDAERMLHRSLQGYEKIIGSDKNSRIINTIMNLGRLRMLQQRFKESEAMFLRALHACEALLGDNGEDANVPLVTTLHNLGLLYRKQDLHADAQGAFERAVQASRKVYGPFNHWTLDTTFHLWQCHAKQGHTAEAAQVLQQAQLGWERALKDAEPEVWITVAIMSKLGQVYAEQGRRVDAERMLARGREAAKALEARGMTMDLDDDDSLNVLELKIARLAL